MGYAFAIIGLAFGLGGPVAGILCNYLKKVYVMELGVVLVGFSNFLVGPSFYLGFEPRLWIMLVGLFSLAFFAAFNYTPVIPEIIEATKEHQREQITRKCRLAGLEEEQIEVKV